MYTLVFLQCRNTKEANYLSIHVHTYRMMMFNVLTQRRLEPLLSTHDQRYWSANTRSHTARKEKLVLKVDWLPESVHHRPCSVKFFLKSGEWLHRAHMYQTSNHKLPILLGTVERPITTVTRNFVQVTLFRLVVTRFLTDL